MIINVKELEELLKENEKVSIEELKNNLIKKLNDNINDLSQFKVDIELLKVILENEKKIR